MDNVFNVAQAHVLPGHIKLWRLPQFFSPELLQFIEEKILNKEFVLKEYGQFEGKPLYSELTHASKYTEILQMHLQDQAMIKTIASLTGLSELGKVGSRVYKFIPNSGNWFGWHDDVSPGRMIGFSVNLTKAPYQGGVFRIRKKNDPHSIFEFQNSGYGDAILFSIGPELEHSVTPVTGTVERIACAGWFYHQDFEIK